MLELGSESDFSTIAVNFTMSFLLTLHQVTYATYYIIKGIKGDYKESTIRGQTRVIFVGWTYQPHHATTHKNDPCSPMSPW